jgi:hypothetical protein
MLLLLLLLQTPSQAAAAAPVTPGIKPVIIRCAADIPSASALLPELPDPAETRVLSLLAAAVAAPAAVSRDTALQSCKLMARLSGVDGMSQPSSRFKLGFRAFG